MPKDIFLITLFSLYLEINTRKCIILTKIRNYNLKTNNNMALIKCPECGKEISDKANDCVHCGYQLDTLERLMEKVEDFHLRRRVTGTGTIEP